MTTDDSLQQTDIPPWCGFHHIALVTPDLGATIAFYSEVLGMEAGTVFEATAQQGRHVFIKPGATDAWGMHFFEQPDAQLFPYPTDFPRIFVPGALQHIAFALPNREAALALRERLEQAGVVATPFNRIGPIENMLFHDNNGLLLEATWPHQVVA